VSAVGLIARWLMRELGSDIALSETNRLFVAVAVAVAAFYPNVYEILYWPTCMPIVIGALFFALALFARTVPRVLLATLACLTYETFLLPFIALLAMPALLAPCVALRTRVVRLWRHISSGVAAAALTVGVRLGLALAYGGGYDHRVTLGLKSVVTKLGHTVAQLFVVSFYGASADVPATLAFVTLVVATCVLAWHARRWQPLVALALCIASTAVYWVLTYSAPRAIYGSQLVLGGLVVWLVSEATRVARLPHALSGLAVLAVFLAFFVHTLGVFGLKTHNAAVLTAREASLMRKIETCSLPCRIEYGDLRAGLLPDWVLPPEYWPSYLEWLRWRSAPGKVVEFVHVPESQPPGS